MKFATSILATAILLSEIVQAHQEHASKPNALHGKHAFHRAATASRTGRSMIANPLAKRHAGPHYCQNYEWDPVDWPLDGYCEGLAYDGGNIPCWRENQCPIESVDGIRFPCTWHKTHEAYASCDGHDIFTGYDSPPSSPEPQPAQPARAKRSNNKARPANARTPSKSSKAPPVEKQRLVQKSKPRLATKSKKDQERVAKAKAKAQAKGTKKSAPAKNPAPVKKLSPAKPAGKAKGPLKRRAPLKRRTPLNRRAPRKV
ncbi:unnamed protein product [Clonostachys byssicola]|uniref:Uncharacterized protein n=1 Tax=Clonostachys byssicola TaxID=160290 RepID=A0A9N9UU05_9HYPO|nr:unnamed protein product [Clonostachys byssicola]